MVSDEVLIDDQSHYEVSLTAGQAFVAFVLLLLSLAASFAFGLMIGRGQADERLIVRKEPAVINEGSVAASRKNDGKLVDLGVGNDDFKAPVSRLPTPLTETGAPSITSAITEGTATPSNQPPGTPSAAPSPSVPMAEAPKPAVKTPASAGPAYAQLLVTSDQKTADALAAKVIDHGFTSAYVERSGTTFKVRVSFNSEADARASEAKLKELSKEVWITK